MVVLVERKRFFADERFSDAASPSRVALQKIAELKCASKRNAAHSRDVSIASSGKEEVPPSQLSLSLSLLSSPVVKKFFTHREEVFLYDLCVKMKK